MKRPPPEVCPICGEDVPRTAQACPECGACHESGWSENTYLDGIDLPGEEDEEFDYDEWLAREEGRKRGPGDGLPSYWRWVALLLLVGMILGAWKLLS